MLIMLLLETVVFLILNVGELNIFKGHLFSNAVKTMLFISDAQY